MWIGGRSLRGKYLSSTKRDLTRWLSLKLGSSGNIGMLVSLKDQLLSPNLQLALQSFSDELHLWKAAGAKGLRVLGKGQVV